MNFLNFLSRHSSARFEAIIEISLKHQWGRSKLAGKGMVGALGFTSRQNDKGQKGRNLECVWRVPKQCDLQGLAGICSQKYSPDFGFLYVQ